MRVCASKQWFASGCTSNEDDPYSGCPKSPITPDITKKNSYTVLED